jgi:hypothetical protein
MEFEGYMGGIDKGIKVCFLYIKNHDHRHGLVAIIDLKQHLIWIKIISSQVGWYYFFVY